jgi:hypothetical protein
MIVDDELEEKGKEVVMAYIKKHSLIFLKGLKKSTKIQLE